MRLIIVRHGETEANVRRIIQGHGNTPLSERGRAQAFELARRLVAERIDACYSSDLLRAKETADIVSAAIKVPVALRPELRERCYGVFEGHSVTEYEAALLESGLAREKYVPPNGESLSNVQRRASGFVSTLLEPMRGKTVLVVAHSGTNRAIIQTLLRKDFSEWTRIEQDNACLNVFELSANSVETELLNCTAHLAPVGFTPLALSE